MTSSPETGPGPGDELEGPPSGVRSPLSRGLAAARGWLVVLVVALLVVPFGARVLDQVPGDGDPAAEEALGVRLDQAERDELLAQAVMLVVSATCGDNARCGSGFALDIAGEVVVVTNRHVVEGACSTTLQPLGGGPEVAVREARLAREADVAVLVLDEVVGRVPLTGASAEVLVGQAIEVVGFPGAEPTVLSGSVERIEPGRLVLAMEADHGASGSPVFDASGAVVGQLYARLQDEQCCVAMPIADVVAAAREAEPVAVCP